tara:strand:- start:687 stop:950 length:264 start_codon:yes stop_codon:yes gene_type:complete
MPFFVYLIISKKNNKYTSYVGYTSDLKRRLELHNTSKGAKFTRGRLWSLIYKKKYKNKSLAMKEEYLLKKNYKLRKQIKNSYIKNVK